MGRTKSDLYASMEAQFKPRHEAGSANMQIGLGWHIVRKPYGQVIWHNGGTGGYHSFMGFSPETGRGVAVLANSANDIDGLALRILEAGAPAKKPASAPAEQK
jgi:CubicO group peptidase (beta-lactamase class C family)